MILWILRGGFLAGGLLLVGAEVWLASRPGRALRPARWALAAWGGASLGWLGYLFVNHLRFPLYLDLMEGVVVQQLRLAMAGLPVYPAPSPDLVPLAYNPLLYYVAAPLAWLAPPLVALRLVAIGATMVCLAVLWSVVRERTGSAWWALTATGLFAAAYRLMDAYLDTGHSDAPMLAAALLGALVLSRRRSTAGTLGGMLLLVCSFWFKQHGAFFVAGGLLYLLRRDGWKRSLPAAALAAALGPGVYLLLGPTLFGERFWYFTWTVPSAWSEWGMQPAIRLAGYLALGIPLLTAAAVSWWLGRSPEGPDVWRTMLPFAVATGVLGALDPGSSDNVLIPMTVWLLLGGVLGLRALDLRFPRGAAAGLVPAALFLSFGLLVYPPRTVRCAGDANARYAEMAGLVESMGGPVYAPGIGPLPDRDLLHPTAHWVGYYDMIRGPGRDVRDHPIVHEILDPVIHPGGPAFILANERLEDQPWLAFLGESYVLQEDLGKRFRSLQVLPGRWKHGWPRYLYRHEGASAP